MTALSILVQQGKVFTINNGSNEYIELNFCYFNNPPIINHQQALLKPL
jgi:hypothetical protein